jgi:hypothetical protein
MLRGGIKEKTIEEEIEAQLILDEVLREGRGERDEIGEREGKLFLKTCCSCYLFCPFYCCL